MRVDRLHSALLRDQVYVETALEPGQQEAPMNDADCHERMEDKRLIETRHLDQNLGDSSSESPHERNSDDSS